MYYWLNMISLFCLIMGICLAFEGSAPSVVEAVMLCLAAFFNLISSGYATLKFENLENRITDIEKRSETNGR